MRVSVIIPVWNGADVLQPCLDAVCTHSGERRPEVICVDNRSHDGSATLIEEAYPWVHLIRQPVNLGFAGGVNAGIDVTDGDLVVLLNQDCRVHPGWLEALCAAFDEAPALGIAGCTMLQADGSLDHAGATVRRPDAAGVHLTQPGTGRWAPVDYVTGAAMALRRSTWEMVGRFDEGFYPAYYEDADYCYRARRHGVEVAHVPAALVTHLFSNQGWKTEPLTHTANQHRARYRFVAKHFNPDEIAAWVTAEGEALAGETYLDQAVARALAARDAVTSLPDVMERRRADLGEPPPALPRQMAVALGEIRHLALAAVDRLLNTGLEEPPVEDWRRRSQALRQELVDTLAGRPADHWPAAGARFRDTLADLRQQEQELLSRLHFHPQDATTESRWRRGLRHTILRLLSVLSGREDMLQTRLHVLHLQQLDVMARQVEALTDQATQVHSRQLDLLRTLLDEHEQQAAWQRNYDLERMERRMELLRALAEHE